MCKSLGNVYGVSICRATGTSLDLFPGYPLGISQKGEVQFMCLGCLPLILTLVP